MESAVLNIDKYDVLRYAETLSEEDLQLLREQLTLIQNVKYPVVYNNGFIGKVPEHEKHTSKKSIEDRMRDFKEYLEKDLAELNRKSFINIPPYQPRHLDGVSDGEPRPPFVPAPPVMVWKDCTCSKFWSMVCKCGGGRLVPEDEL